MILTAERLREVGACEDQVELFQTLFPSGGVPTVAWCVKHAKQFDWFWAAEYLLKATARAQYKAAMATARAQYKAAMATALAQYNAATATARAQYQADDATAWAQAWAAQ